MTESRVVCVSGLPIDVKISTVVEAVESETNLPVGKSIFVWNSGVALMEVKGLQSLPAEKVLLTSIKPARGRCARLQLSAKDYVGETLPSSVVNVRCYAIDPERDLRQSSTEERARYRKAATAWSSGDESDISDVLELAITVSCKAGALYEQFALPQKAFSKTRPGKEKKEQKTAPRLYAQIFMKFGTIEEAQQVRRVDGEVVRVRGLDCVLRVEGLTPEQHNTVSGMAHVTNPFLQDDGSDPPPLVNDSSLDDSGDDSPGYESLDNTSSSYTSPHASRRSRDRKMHKRVTFTPPVASLVRPGSLGPHAGNRRLAGGGC